MSYKIDWDKNGRDIEYELKKLLIDLYLAQYRYQIDVYAYVENGTVVFDTFDNPGGNSWYEDDHFTVFNFRGDMISKFPDIFEIEDYANLLKMTKEELIELVAKELKINTEDVDKYECKRAIRDNEELNERYDKGYEEFLWDSDYVTDDVTSALERLKYEIKESEKMEVICR